MTCIGFGQAVNPGPSFSMFTRRGTHNRPTCGSIARVNSSHLGERRKKAGGTWKKTERMADFHLADAVSRYDSWLLEGRYMHEIKSRLSQALSRHPFSLSPTRVQMELPPRRRQRS